MTQPTFYQAQAFFHLLFGDKPIGINAGGFEVSTPISPDLRTFFAGLLPEGPVATRGRTEAGQARARAMTQAIRALCDAFDQGPRPKGEDQVSESQEPKP